MATIVARYSTPDANEQRINVRLASVRQSIEHIFALHKKTFNLFNVAESFRLMENGKESYRLVLNSLFLMNCYICLNESANHFNLRPPTLEEYIPLTETLKAAPIIDDELLGEVYNYTV